MKKNKYSNYLKNVVVPCLVYGAFTGIAVGTVVYFFKLGAEFLVEKSVELYKAVSANPAYIPLVFAVLVLLAVAMHFMHKWAAETKGGGIPRAEGVLRGILTFRWLRSAIAVIVNSYISFFAGLPLGSEGPSVLLGTSLGAGTSKLPLSHNSWDRYIMTGGASAGFAVATNAPLSGIIFALEEAHKRFTPMILLMAFSSVLFATATSNLWTMAIGHESVPLFVIPQMPQLALSDVWIMLLLGVAVGLVACLFNFLIFKLGILWETKLKKVHSLIRLVSVFVLVGVMGLLLPDALGGGGGLIVKVTDINFAPLYMLIILFAVKFVMISLCTSTGATGGMFIPMLCVGALLGALMGKLFVAMGMSQDLYVAVVLISMTAFMGASTRAPLTAMVFIVESTWQFTNLFYVGVTVFISFFIAEILKVEPLYDVLLDRMIEKQNEGKTSEIVKFKYVVKQGSFAVGKSVRDILWPANTKVRDISSDDSVKRMDDDGEKKIYAGDVVTLQCQTFDRAATEKELSEILGFQDETSSNSALTEG
ncbi:MAG: ClC family H(+)/Cl(-) exchange transporter [Corallococcus sp.]|nr:ClC family H(+)/Cl(-) exchange transporter [Corallococcus sp.]